MRGWRMAVRPGRDQAQVPRSLHRTVVAIVVAALISHPERSLTMPNVSRRHLLGAAAAVSVAPVRARAATELIVTVPGGSLEEGWRKSVIAPFEAANPGVTVKIVQGLTFQNVALM